MDVEGVEIAVVAEPAHQTQPTQPVILSSLSFHRVCVCVEGARIVAMGMWMCIVGLNQYTTTPRLIHILCP
jgi:hypothetical protein